MIVQADDFYTFLHRCVSEGLGNIREIILPARSPDAGDGGLCFTHLTPDKDIVLDGYRTVDPVKILFYLFREHMINKVYEEKMRIIAGVKACDLKGLQVLDKAMINDDFVDPSYKHWRDHTYIISSDCTETASSCHCTLVDGKPYPESGFDLNLSRAGNDYVIQTGSDKGQELLTLLKQHLPLREAPADSSATVQRNRDEMTKRLSDQNTEFLRHSDYGGLKSVTAEFWKSESRNCVGCGGCTNICPTCYCLILNDESEEATFKKVRSYDSCQFNGYARVAGGATPRPLMYQRFKNRYLCKFIYMKSNFGTVGCSGCGRCIDVCPARIEFRQVVKNAEQQTPAIVSRTAEPAAQPTGEI